MQFLYHQAAGARLIQLNKGELLHLMALRLAPQSELFLRNLKDDYLYLYELIELGKKNATLLFKDKKEKRRTKSLSSLALAVIEPKILERLLPFLNELNLGKLILVYADFSQRNFRIDFQRLERILIHSCEQCG